MCGAPLRAAAADACGNVSRFCSRNYYWLSSLTRRWCCQGREFQWRPGYSCGVPYWEVTESHQTARHCLLHSPSLTFLTHPQARRTTNQRFLSSRSVLQSVSMIWFPEIIFLGISPNSGSGIRQASFIKPLMEEQWRHALCFGDGRNWTHAVLVRVWLDTAFTLAKLRGRSRTIDSYWFKYFHVRTKVKSNNEKYSARTFKWYQVWI